MLSTCPTNTLIKNIVNYPNSNNLNTCGKKYKLPLYNYWTGTTNKNSFEFWYELKSRNKKKQKVTVAKWQALAYPVKDRCNQKQINSYSKRCNCS